MWCRSTGWSPDAHSRCRAFPTRPTMAHQLRLFSDAVTNVPQLGDSITEGTIIEFHKAVGDSVAVDDVVLTIETDKVTMEVRSADSGTLAEFFAAVNDDVQVGAALFRVSSDGSSVAPSTTTTSTASSSAAKEAPAASTSSQADSTKKAEPSSPSPAPSPSQASASSSAHGHVPLIQFRYGVRDATQSKSPAKASSAPQLDAPTLKATPLPKSTSEKITELDAVPNDLQRQPLTDFEIDFIETGGAIAFD